VAVARKRTAWTKDKTISRLAVAERDIEQQ
jgi:hypothetical protein